MAIINPAKQVSITNGYLNLPITAGVTPNGYWYTYLPANPSNTSLGASIVIYRWDVQLPIVGGAPSLTMNGTMPLITESWNGVNTQYHGSATEWIGPGVNDVTNAQEDDAFFFSHLGTTSTSPSNNVFTGIVHLNLLPVQIGNTINITSTALLLM